jgi:hypothetical protein
LEKNSSNLSLRFDRWHAETNWNLAVSRAVKVKGEEEAEAKNKEHVKEEKKVVGVWV